MLVFKSHIWYLIRGIKNLLKFSLVTGFVFFLPIVLVILFLFVMMFYTHAKIYLLDQPHDPFQTFELPHERSITIYTDYDWLHEPPGHLYFDVTEKGDTILEDRIFENVSPRIYPYKEFKVVTSNDGQLVAILYYANVVILHDFKTNRTWPGPEGKKWNQSRITWADHLLVQEFLSRFKAEGKTLYCSLLGDRPSKTIASPNYQFHVRHDWETGEGQPGFHLRVRLFSGEKEIRTLLETRFQLSGDRANYSQQWYRWNEHWKAGWLDQSTFVVWSRDQGTRFWKLDAEGNCTEQFALLNPALQAEIQKFPSSPWRIPTNAWPQKKP
ncbi:hypothetical protein Pan153_47690 [Gimesia panareensis]|uniref:Uncharacterized protein n=1 Tax=Gimesia panareensis TaxID=2527978 RepID=A0A518FUT1_9PLAN|nr:hypothetical protein [Gimesia panareensis]QDV20098.1 hypothetical protein Pan153_47690 [Gimesia panareensis]